MAGSEETDIPFQVYATYGRQFQDEQRLEELGRQPSLHMSRRLIKTIAVVGLAATVVVTWQNSLLLAAIALSSGGTGGFIWTSIVVSPCMFVVYIGMAEKAEMWPVAAGQYHWVYHLAPHRYARGLSFISAWKIMIAWQLFLTAGITLVGNGISALVFYFQASCPHWVTTVASILMILPLWAVNYWLPRGLAKAEFPMLVFHCAALLLLIIVVVSQWNQAPHYRLEHSRVWFTFRNGGGWFSTGWSVFLSALVPMSSNIGYDCICHLSEEIKQASTIIPKALLIGSGINAVLSTGIVIFIAYIVNDVDTLLQEPLSLSGPVGPVVQIIATATQSTHWTIIAFCPVLVTLVFCCINSFQAASRQLWALAVDNGLPYSRWIRQLDEGHDVPYKALALTVPGPMLLSLLNLGAETALNAIVSLVVINLMVSYILVAAMSFWSRWRHPKTIHPRSEKYALGYRVGLAVDAFTCVFLAACTLVALFPAAVNPTPAEMNWAVVILVGDAMLGGVVWWVFAKESYNIPQDSI